jgi:hypothetical protein
MAGKLDCHLLHVRFLDRITAGLACGSKNLHWTVEIHFTFGYDRIIDSIGHQSCISLKQRQTTLTSLPFSYAFLFFLILS